MRQHTGPLLLLALAAQAAIAAAQSAAPATPAAAGSAQTPSFPAQVEQVIVDVVVVDKKGTPVKGLTKESMTVLEDGVAQPVTSFEAIELPEEPTPVTAVPPRVSVNTDPAEQRGRTFAIVFDDTHITPTRANPAKAAVSSFLEKGVRDGDRVSLVSTAGGTWWTTRMPQGREKLLDLLKRFDGRYIPDYGNDRMSDAEAMRIHVYRDPLVAERVLRRWEQYGVQSTMQRPSSQSDAMRSGTVDDPYLTGRASEVYYQATTRLRTTLDTMERVINGLSTARGRKSLVLVSEGFIYDINLDEFKRVNEAARRANVAIYFVNSRGLEGLPDYMTAQFGPALPDQDVGYAFTDQLDAVAGSEVISAESGGFIVRNTNDLAGGVQRIASETRAYYLLGYIPSNTARDGKFRKIQVKLADSKGLQVRARKGYYAPSDLPGKNALEAKKGVDPVIQAALDSPWAQDGIPLRMTEYVGDERMLGKATVLVATEIDVRSVDFEEKEGRQIGELEFLLVVAHRETGEFFRYDQGINMKLLPATRERLGKLWYPLVRDFELRSGDYQAKIVVRDKKSGRVGTVMHEFVVPPLEGFRVSTPIISDSPQPPAPGQSAPRLTVMARRQFASGSDMYCQFEVYGAQKDEKTGQPAVRQGYEVRRADGTVLTSMAPSIIKPTSLGAVNRFFGFRLADAAPGPYELFMTVRDEVAGRSTEVREAFEVLPEGSMPIQPMGSGAAAPEAGAPAASATPPGGDAPKP